MRNQPSYTAWTITLNNYTEDDVEHFKQRGSASDVKYFCFQKEVGAEGTPHLQGYVYLSTRRSLAWLRREISARAHFEKAKGNPEQNRIYCSKEGGSEFWEHGELGRIGQGARSDLYAVADAVKAKRPIRDIATEYPVEFIKYQRGIIGLAAAIGPKRTEKSVVYWFYGSTGTGKTRRAYELAPFAYTKMGCNKWWDGYDGDLDVVIDDYRRDFCTFAELLRLLDRYPYRVEIKGGTTEFVAHRIFITTPKSPRDTWEGRTEEDLEQLERRIEHVVHFGAHAFNPYNV